MLKIKEQLRIEGTEFVPERKEQMMKPASWLPYNSDWRMEEMIG